MTIDTPIRPAIDMATDYSKSFHLLRPQIVDSRGIRYHDFLKSLSPRYRSVWLDIALGYASLLATCVLVVALPSRGLLSPWLAAAIGAISIGFWIAYLQLFIHEGAHFNLSPDRERSDFISNLLIAWMIGSSVQKYRVVHFQHHRELGGVNDSEMTYFFPLNLVFIAKGLFGIRVLEVLSSRKATQEQAVSHQRGKYVGLAGLIAHMLILAATYFLGSIWLSLSWIAGVGAIFPFFGALRQLLEHRDDRASPGTNYFNTDHGAYTRIFGSDPFSSIFGGAGFNRHLLHHWEPSLSYTNLPELESYLLDTGVANVIAMRRSSYFQTFMTLFHVR
ncbi:fatty acid desaturase [Bradyrhizobium sp.]|uniref:fatty acid desaturase family protein n=1 Tax=Bradyrhizobium sp. TaxID=376 RepID=UPI0026307146|nr:fatty acid desaturase [Bradyrhizobium sp.]